MGCVVDRQQTDYSRFEDGVLLFVKFALDCTDDLFAIAELRKSDCTFAEKVWLFFGFDIAIDDIVDAFFLFVLEMLHLDKHKIAKTSEIRKSSSLSLFDKVVVEHAAAKLVDDKVFKDCW